MAYIIIAESIIILLLGIKYWSLKVGLMATIAWMEENKMPQPSDEKRHALSKWVVAHMWKDLWR